jgi:hypothetical protein
MPLTPPRLDDRTFTDLVDEALARIPAHTPEWTHPRQGDPGVTLVELFAFLTDSLLYRANLIPERQRLVFLRLLGMAMRPAIPASGIVTVQFDNKETSQPLAIRAQAALDKPVHFETRTELTVLPVIGEFYAKRRLMPSERALFDPLVPQLRQVYRLDRTPTPYIVHPLFQGGMAEAGGFDLVQETIDSTLWLALLTLKERPDEAFKALVRAGLGDGRQILNIGLAPADNPVELSEDIGPRAAIQHTWQISHVRDARTAGYTPLALVPKSDTTRGLIRAGVMRLVLPGKDLIGAPDNDVRRVLGAGVGDSPPRIDDPEKARRLVAWVRLQPMQALESLRLSWAGLNAVEVDARTTVTGRLIGQSDGSADQEMRLPAASVEPDSLLLQVEEPGLGYRGWQRIDDLALAGRDDAVFSIDSESGTIRFGNGVRGRVPYAGSRVRVERMRAGGGQAGNLPAGTLTELRAQELASGFPTPRLKVVQGLPTRGGQEAETLAEAEQRIPAAFRHRDRVVTGEDYQRLALTTPGVRVGRVEVLPRFKPHQRLFDVPGVVSVMVLPYKDPADEPNPRADRHFLETVFAYLDARRPLATELYAIGCEYIPVGVSLGLSIQDGAAVQTVTQAVEQALRRYLWPLTPGGGRGTGWELGRSVVDRELEVIVSRVPGVSRVNGIHLFEQSGESWQLVRAPGTAPAHVRLEHWQLPELLAVVIDPSGLGSAPADLDLLPNPFAGQDVIGVPVAPEVC